MLEPSSRIGSFLFKTRVIRHYGRKVLRRLPTYSTLLPDGNKILIRPADKSHEWTVQEIYQERAYEQMFSISKGDTVIDVGANIGIFTVKASRLVGPTGTVVSLEPASKSFTLLEANIERNDLSNVKPFKYAVSDSEGEARLYVDRVSDRSSLFSDRGDSERNRRNIETVEKVETVSLDTLGDSLKLNRIDIIKIDVEGAELAVLKGAKRTIAKYWPNIVLEWHPWGGPLDEIHSFLSSCDYKVLESEHRSDRTMVYTAPDNSHGIDNRTLSGGK